MKKIEIIIESNHLDRATAVLDEAGAAGYTVIDIAKSKGALGGIKQPMGFGSVHDGSYVITIVTAEQENKIVSKLTPVLKDLGAVLITSDVTGYFPH
jgi:nitrogen regulatory protein PII